MSAAAAAIVVLALIAAGVLFLGDVFAKAPRTAAVHVEGNRIVNQSGTPIRLLGVDRSGTEYMCLGSGVFYGPTGDASVRALTSWDIDAVRLPLNEDCWLDINGVASRYSGAHYRSAIERYVSLLSAAGIVTILDLHWNAPGAELARGQQQMADQSHSPAFWKSVAKTFRHMPDVVFDLYNEPWGISWQCWLNGCGTAAGWLTAGMQELVDDVRGAGATQPIMVGGLNDASDLSQWLAYEPVDPLHQLIASVHIYNPGGCDRLNCWTYVLKPVASRVPIVTGEMGEFDCRDGFIDEYMAWADRAGVSYLAWVWDAGWGCDKSVIATWSGTATRYGVGLRDHLRALHRTA